MRLGANLYLLLFSSAFLLTFLVTPLVIRLAHLLKLYDPPDERKLHTRNIPRLGGIALLAGFLFTNVIVYLQFVRGRSEILFTYDQYRLIILGLVLFALLGLIDDLFTLPSKVKLLLQILIAYLLVALPDGLVIHFVNIPSKGIVFLTNWQAQVLSIIWIVGSVNMMNFIDGLDGLCAGTALISAAAFFYLSILKGLLLASIISASFIGVLLAFLIFNFHPAKIFLGDSGSLTVGFALASISIVGALKTTMAITFFLPLIILGIPVLDTAFAIVRRLWRREAIDAADRKHIHHRVLNYFNRRYLHRYGLANSNSQGQGNKVASQIARETASSESVSVSGGRVESPVTTHVIDFPRVKDSTPGLPAEFPLSGRAYVQAVVTLYLASTLLALIAIFLGIKVG